MGIFDDLFGKKPQKINILGKEYDINPESLAHSQVGLDKYQVKDYKNAVIAFSKAISLTPENQNLYLMRGTSYEDMGNDIEAEKDFNKTLQLNPENFVAAYRLGMVYYRKKNFETAIKWLKISHSNTVDIPELNDLGFGKNNILFVGKQVISANLGNFLIQLKKYDEAFKYLDEAIELEPEYAHPYMTKGMGYAQMGNPKAGIPYLKKAMSLGAPQAAAALQLLEQLANEQSTNEHEDLELEFVFHSSDHIRYQNGKHVSGPHGGAPRAIQVEGNINGGAGYSVTMFNTEGGQAVAQMAPKQMKLQAMNDDRITLLGYGMDSLGVPFSDYGLSIYHNQGVIQKCILHMHDRDVDIEYLP